MSEEGTPKLRATKRGSVRYDPETDKLTITPRPLFLRLDGSRRGRVAAFDDARQKLAVAAELYDCLDDDRRAGIYRALLAVMEYFSERGIPRATLHPIYAAAAALIDAERGIETPAFKPIRPRHGGRPEKSILRLNFEGTLAAVAELCIRHCQQQGMRPYVEPGIDLAVKLINRSPTASKTNKTELRELRERIRSTSGGEDRAQFDIQTSLPMTKIVPLEVAKMLINHEWMIAE